MSRTPALAVPGPWPSPHAAFSSLTEAAFAPYATGPDLPDLSLSGRGHDAGTVAFVRATGSAFLSAATLDAVERHATLVVFDAPASPVGARALLVTAAALLDAGGAVVRVDGAVKTVDADRWRALAADPHPLAPYAALVQVVEDATRGTHSVGMHHFGLPDVRIDVPMPPATAFEAVHRINQMQLADASPFADGLPIAIDGRAGLVLRHEDDRFAAEGQPWANPYGRWRLTAAAADASPLG